MRCFSVWLRLEEYHLVSRDRPCLLIRKKQWIIAKFEISNNIKTQNLGLLIDRVRFGYKLISSFILLFWLFWDLDLFPFWLYWLLLGFGRAFDRIFLVFFRMGRLMLLIMVIWAVAVTLRLTTLDFSITESIYNKKQDSYYYHNDHYLQLITNEVSLMHFNLRSMMSGHQFIYFLDFGERKAWYFFMSPRDGWIFFMAFHIV